MEGQGKFLQSNEIIIFHEAMLLNVTDQGIPKVPENFPTCPNKAADKIDKVELVDLRSIGQNQPQESSSLKHSFWLFCLLLIKLL